ncbi:MAG: AAA family ATPase, partial [Flavobacteriales bacterium]|nr:AAA family ATPase [Flavobacteriales bacterium]
MRNGDIFFQTFLRKFPYQPSSSQEQAMEMLSAFSQGEALSRVFVLKGFAGTGKTSIIAALVSTINEFKGIKGSTTLMAPTGRAAKIMSQYSGQRAYTIHKQIYALRTKSGGGLTFTLKPNKNHNTLYIVDEASMVTDRTDGSTGYASLLDDLISYVTSGQDCKLLLVGDTAQLPPVGYSESPALDISVLSNGYGLACQEVFLTDVYRQSEQSVILQNATLLRQSMRKDDLKCRCEVQNR